MSTRTLAVSVADYSMTYEDRFSPCTYVRQPRARIDQDELQLCNMRMITFGQQHQVAGNQWLSQLCTPLGPIHDFGHREFSPVVQPLPCRG